MSHLETNKRKTKEKDHDLAFCKLNWLKPILQLGPNVTFVSILFCLPFESTNTYINNKRDTIFTLGAMNSQLDMCSA